MNKDYATKELKDIARLLTDVSNRFDDKTAWQTCFISQYLSNLEYAEAKLKGLIGAIKTEFSRKKS